MKIVEIVEVEKRHYKLCFDDARVPGSGYAFPCDKDGHILWDDCLSPEATQKSFEFCKAHPEKWTPESQHGQVVEFFTPVRYGICPYCGGKVYFCGAGYMGAYECECGKWYTAWGQNVRPPEEWDDLDEPLEPDPEF